METNRCAGARSHRNYVIVSLVFVVLASSLQVMIWFYWNRVLEPRLRLEAESQANVLAHSQAARLADALMVDVSTQRLQALNETIDEILLFTGPETNVPLFLGIDLEIDYDVIAVPAGSLDLTHGQTQAENCFMAEVGLYSPLSDELVGIARFRVSDRLFQSLSRDVKKTLFTQSRLGILLLIGVWGVVMFLFKEINRSRQQAETANRAKSAFLANMSHELRTPLNAIIGFSDLMHRDPGFSPKQKENLSIINRSGNYLLELINDVLELSRIEAAQYPSMETTFDLYMTLDNVAKMIRLRVEKKNLQFVFERPDNVPRYVITDERKLRQILLNLLGNAVKFTDDGSVTLRVCLEQNDRAAKNDDGLVLCFEVEDCGPGISPEERTRIFDAFTQTRNGYNKKEGTGLGLTISRQFVEHLGGEITVSSVVGKGTVFRFTIKAKSGMASSMVSNHQERRVIGLAHSGDSPEEPYRILVVDDYRDNRSLLKLFLEQVGFSVKTAENGQQAVALNRTWKPHLIWMDMRMPVMDGYEATRIIRSKQENTTGMQPVIIALTASAFKEERDAVIAAGCDDFVRRPVRESEILDKMQRYLGLVFVYETDETDETVSELREDAIKASIKALPADVVAEFKHAVETIDYDRAMAIVETLQDQNRDLAGALADLLNSYRFDTLQQVFDENVPGA